MSHKVPNVPIAPCVIRKAGVKRIRPGGLGM